MPDETDKTLRARQMRDLPRGERDAAIAQSINVVDARSRFAAARVDHMMKVSEDDCA